MNRILAFFFAAMSCVTVAAQQDNQEAVVSVGYINKQWVSDFNGDDYRENIFGQEDKRLHGVQFSLRYATWLPIGVGVQTGLGYEWCMSFSEEVEKMGFDRFNEHSLYLPLHAIWRIPVAKDFSITPYAGLGFNWKFNANLKNGELRQEPYSDEYFFHRWGDDYQRVRYGKDGWPHALNSQFEMGVNIRIQDVVVGFTYSKGIRDHEFYKADRVKTRQDKLAITVGLRMKD